MTGYSLTKFFAGDDYHQQYDRKDCRYSAGGRIDPVRNKQTGNDINKTEQDRKLHRRPESLLKLQRRRYRQGNQGTDDQNTDDADRHRDRRRDEDGKDIINDFTFYPGYFRPVFIEGQHHQLRIEPDNRADGYDTEQDDGPHIALRYRQNAAEKERFHIGMNQPGTDDGNGNAHRQGQYDDQDKFGIPAELISQYFDEYPEKRSQAERTEDRVHIQQQTDSYAGQ